MAEPPVYVAQVWEINQQISELHVAMQQLVQQWAPFCQAGSTLSECQRTVHKSMTDTASKAFTGERGILVTELCSGMSALASLQTGLYNVLQASAPDLFGVDKGMAALAEKRVAHAAATEQYTTALDRTVALSASAPAEKLKQADDELASKRRTADLHRMDLMHRLLDKRAQGQHEYLHMLEALLRSQLSFYEAGQLKLRQLLPRLEKLMGGPGQGSNPPPADARA